MYIDIHLTYKISRVILYVLISDEIIHYVYQFVEKKNLPCVKYNL